MLRKSVPYRKKEPRNGGLCRQSFSILVAPSLQYQTPVLGPHPFHKAVLPFALPLLWLICPAHISILLPQRAVSAFTKNASFPLCPCTILPDKNEDCEESSFSIVNAAKPRMRTYLPVCSADTIIEQPLLPCQGKHLSVILNLRGKSVSIYIV